MISSVLAVVLSLAQADSPEAAFSKFEDAVHRAEAIQLSLCQSGVLHTAGTVASKLEVKGTLALASGNRMALKVVQTIDWCEPGRKDSVSEISIISDGSVMRETVVIDGKETVAEKKTPTLLRANVLVALTRTGIGYSAVQSIRQGFRRPGGSGDEFDYKMLFPITELGFGEPEKGSQVLTYRLPNHLDCKLWYDPVVGKPLKRVLHFMSGSEDNTFTDVYEDMNLAANPPKETFSIEKKK